MNDFVAHLTRQAVFSRANFGPGVRTDGIIDHIQREIKEVETVYSGPETDQTVHREAALEWTDIVILGLDGLLRALAAHDPHVTYDVIAARAVKMITEKQGKNERRTWPDWRTAPFGRAIEHVKAGSAVQETGPVPFKTRREEDLYPNVLHGKKANFAPET